MPALTHYYVSETIWRLVNVKTNKHSDCESRNRAEELAALADFLFDEPKENFVIQQVARWNDGHERVISERPAFLRTGVA